MNSKNNYDVNTYTDDELLELLDLSNPTDRELEAKIIHLIRKYDNIISPSADILSKFYRDIYFRFFDGGYNKEEVVVEELEVEEEEEEEEKIIEGFESTTKATTTDSDSSQKLQVKPKPEIQLTSTLDYAKGKLNPILKQTYKRTICIDSQYREPKNTLSTDFTLNFTETLKDVVSLKLYAIQIPYTWYTISRNYGSNFIYLKGNSPGINNGNHDFKFTIEPGNYQQNTIVNAINTNIQNLSNIYTDVSFGNTSFIYNPTSCIANFILDIQLSYNETCYHFNFSDNFYSPVPIENNIPRNYHLNTFLGLNYSNYSISSVYSSRNIQPLNSNNSNYSFDTSNNTIYIIQYAPTLDRFGRIMDYNDNCSIYQKIPISFPISYDNATYSQSAILRQVLNTLTTTLKTTNKFNILNVTFNNITDIDICGNIIDNNGLNYFKWDIKLNRYAGFNIPGSKLCLIVPSIENNILHPIWKGENSCFHFTSTINELNHIISETRIPNSSFDISGNVYFEFICNNPLYNINGINNISSGIIINNTNYSLNQYIAAIDYRFDVMNANLFALNGNSNVFIRNYSFANINPIDSKFHIQMDIYRKFSTNNFRMDISGAFVNTLRFSPIRDLNKNIALTDNYSINSIFIQRASYSIDSTNNLIIIITTDGINSIKSGFSSDIYYNIYLPIGIYNGFVDLENGINNTFRSFSDSLGSYPLFYSSVTITQIGNNELNCNFKIIIQKQLSQYDYTLYFHDVINNSWNNYLALTNNSYNLINYTYPTKSYALVIGSKRIETDVIYLNSGGIANRFYISSSEDGVVGSEDLTFDIPPNTYSRNELFIMINSLLSERKTTKGSYLTYIIDPITKYEYTKIVWNINKVYTTTDYKLVFYDLFSFASCSLGSSSVRNATWDTTLGWILGFRYLTEYSLSATNIYYDLNSNKYYYYDIGSDIITTNLYSVTTSTYNSIIDLTADTTVSVNLYNYFMVILDDYNQNHLNDGLVTIAPKDNNLSLPSYANRAKYICNPITGSRINSGITDNGSNNLTQNQIYSINQIINTQNTVKSFTNSGVFVKDIFGLIPIKTTGLSPGQIYVELGGTLQNQDRVYFGPVNIHRMTIKLVNDRGDIVDLNGANWSLQFICEQLYQTTSSNSSSS
jgi:hypothetical protein